MAEKPRAKLLEVTVAGLSDQSWEWRVVAGEEILIIGQGNAALFLTLASSWNK